MAKTAINSSKRNTLGKKWPLFTILLTAGILLSYNFDKPFWGHHDWNGVYWGQVAKNFAVNGPLATKFAMVLNSGPLSFGGLNYNFHFFPTFTLAWALFFKIFGVANWVSRLFAITFSLGTIAIFFAILKNYFNLKTAIIASLFWMATPMFIYFGKMPVHEIPLMFFVLLTFWFYLHKKFWPLLFSILAAELITWSGFFLVPAITIHGLLTKFFSRKYLILWPGSILLFGLHLLHDRLVTGNFFGGGLGEIFLSRVQAVAIVPYLLTLARWAWTYYFLLIPAAILGLIISKNKILLLFLIYGLFYPIVFRDAAIRHDYLLIYFWPFLVLGSALVIRHYFFAFALVTLMIFFRWKFIVALEQSDIYKENVRLGQFINQNSLPQEKIAVVRADSTVPWDGWFIGYYADRAIVEKGADKIFSYLPGGKIRIGAETKSSGTK